MRIIKVGISIGGYRVMNQSLIFTFIFSFFCSGISFAMEPLSELLLEASKTGTLAQVNELIKARADVNYARPHDGNTPMMLAAMFFERRDSDQVCRLLIDHGANVCARNNNGRTAFQIAAFNVHEEVCDIIFKTMLGFNLQEKKAIRAFLRCLRIKWPTNYSNLKNNFKKFVFDVMKAEKKQKAFLEIGTSYDYMGYFRDRYSNQIKTDVE